MGVTGSGLAVLTDRLAAVRWRGRGPAEARLWPVREPGLADLAAAAPELRRFFADRPPTVALSISTTLVRVVEVPRMPVSELRRSWQAEAARYLPFPADDAVVDLDLLPDTQGPMRVLLAATRRQYAEAVGAALGGMRVAAMEPVSVSWCRLLERSGLLRTGQFVVDRSGAAGELVAVADGAPTLGRMFPVNGADDEATGIWREIRRGAEFFRTQLRREPPHLVYLNGPPELVQGVAAAPRPDGGDWQVLAVTTAGLDLPDAAQVPPAAYAALGASLKGARR
jgi:hypothetical protein